MEKQPLVSVIIPTYNREKYIRRAVESVLSQTYKNIEILIIDDSLNNRIKDIVAKIKKRNNRIIYIENKNRLGFTKSLNKGIEIARGKYVARLDDDDFWCNERKLEKQVKFLEDNPSYVLTSAGMIAVNEKNEEYSRVLPPEADGEIRKLMLFDCLIPHSAVVFRKDVWKTLGGYNEQLDPAEAEDWDLWLRMGKIGKMYNFQEYFVVCLWDKQGKTNKYRSLKFNLSLRKKYRNEYPNFWRAYLLGWIYYLYYFIPFKRLIFPVKRHLKNIFFCNQIYKKVNRDNKFL